MEFILTFDNNVIKFVNEHMKSRVMDKIMRFVSALGNNGALWLGIAFGLILMGKEKRRIGTLMLLSLGLEASVCNLVIKPTVARVRPNDAHGLEITIDRPTDYSNPTASVIKTPKIRGLFFIVLHFVLHNIIIVFVYYRVYLYKFTGKRMLIYGFQHVRTVLTQYFHRIFIRDIKR